MFNRRTDYSKTDSIYGSAHLTCLPSCDMVTEATKEFCLRILHAYITVAALSRPVTEYTRLRAIKDMNSLEDLVSSLCPMTDLQNCPVMSEYKAFCRLLFFDNEGNQNDDGG